MWLVRRLKTCVGADYTVQERPFPVAKTVKNHRPPHFSLDLRVSGCSLLALPQTPQLCPWNDKWRRLEYLNVGRSANGMVILCRNGWQFGPYQYRDAVSDFYTANNSPLAMNFQFRVWSKSGSLVLVFRICLQIHLDIHMSFTVCLTAVFVIFSACLTMLNCTIAEGRHSVCPSFCQSVCHTGDTQLNGSRQWNTFYTIRYSNVSSFLTSNFVVEFRVHPEWVR